MIDGQRIMIDLPDHKIGYQEAELMARSIVSEIATDALKRGAAASDLLNKAIEVRDRLGSRGIVELIIGKENIQESIE